MEDYIHKYITEIITGTAYKIHNELGYGFLEKVYKNALIIELKSLSYNVESEVPIKVKYHNKIVGDYITDILVENKVIIEIKAVTKIIPIHEVQLLNYLKATGIKVGLLINFGTSVEISRKVCIK